MTMMQGLPLTGVSVSANAKKRGEVWLSSCMSHVNVMHKLISSLYDGLETDDVYDDDANDLVEIPMGDSARHTQIFADHCYKLVNLMREPTNGPVELPLSNIISVLTRCLKVSYSDVLSVPSRIDLVSLVPRLHQSCMDVLSQLILCCGGDILHQSHIIIDLCLQTLGSTVKMSSDAKSCTRSSTYQALVLWVRTCGWGKYLSSHSKVLIQQIIADTGADTEDQLRKAAQTDGSKSKSEAIGHKRKGKRKKGGKGDSYLELQVEEDGNRKEHCSENRLDLVQWAFSFSQLVVENLPFSTAQNLIAHIVKTASTVQRLSLHRPKPYRQGEARKGLYQAVAACLLSPLIYGCNRNDAVSHYQLTNQALDILSRACHGEESQIETVASQALDILRSSSNLKGPVIRKALDFEDTSVEDISELMREKEQMTDSIEDLRHKLMNSEMENEQQARLISSLREQIAGLQSKVSTVYQESSSTNNKSRSSPKEDSLDNDEDDYSNHDQDESTKETISLALHDENNGEGSSKAESVVKSDVRSTSVKSNKATCNEPTTSNNTTEPRGDNTLEKSVHRDESNVGSSMKLSKRTKTTDEPSNRDVKRPKIDLDIDNSREPGNGVEDMLLDFVDAPPDS